MSLNKEPFYKLVKIGELSQVSKSSMIQFVGMIDNYDSNSNTITLNDQTGNYSLKLPDQFKDMSDKKVLRIFGRWDGINVTVENILEWNIPKEKLSLVHSNIA